MQSITLQIDQITKQFLLNKGSLDVLNGISYTFTSGHTYAITGASGTGKSTLLHLLAGLIEPTNGTLNINGQNLAGFSPEERRHYLNKTVGLLFQMPYLIKELTVLENIMTKGLIIGIKHTACKQEAVELLEKVGLTEKMHEHPCTLSGGQQQRVALARALFGKPAFLLADEPTGNLDAKTGRAIIDLLDECHTKRGMGIIVSTHDPAVAQRMEVQLELQGGCLKQEMSLLSGNLPEQKSVSML